MNRVVLQLLSKLIVVSSLLLTGVLDPGRAMAGIPAGKKIVGYFPEYRIEELPYVNFDHVTHVVFWCLDADANGNLMVGSSVAQGLPQVESAVHARGKKLSICVGGWLTDSYFSPLARSAPARANFISQLLSFCQANRLDGVDLDWEPVADADVPAYTTLLKELDAAFQPYGLLVSLAVSGEHYDVGAAAAPYVDWIAVMGYDLNWAHADHSTYADSVDAMNFWAQSGIERSKLLMGVPFFGLNEGWVEALAYSEIVDFYNPAPEVNNVGGFGFNGIDLIKAKTVFSLSEGFGGMMIWELGQDKFDQRSLLAALATTMGAELPAQPVLPAPWQSMDIGSVGLTGSAGESNGVYSVAGAGTIANTRADAFRFVYQSLSGDGEIQVRVPAETATASGAKVGVMIRETLNANARYALMHVSPAKTFGYQVRTGTGNKASSVRGGAMNVAPNNWVRLVRAGTTITAYKSADGLSWTKVTSSSITMAPTIYIGLAVCSQSTTVLNRATLDRLVVVP